MERPSLFHWLRAILALCFFIALYQALDGVFAPRLWLAVVLGFPALYLGRVVWFGLSGR